MGREDPEPLPPLPLPPIITPAPELLPLPPRNGAADVRMIRARVLMSRDELPPPPPPLPLPPPPPLLPNTPPLELQYDHNLGQT